MSRPEIPEEIRTIAALIGESSQIDSMMTGRSSTLITDTNTLKQGLNQLIQQSRVGQQQPPQPPPFHPQPPPQMAPIPQMEVPQQPIATQATVDTGQLELNLEPSQADTIIDLLKDISLKLKKQNTVLEQIHEELKSKKEGISTVPCESRKNK